MTLAWRYAVHSDVGLLREGNEDSAYAGGHLLAVADGMGGHAAGEVASATAIAALELLDRRGTGPHEPGEALRAAVSAANTTLRDMAAADSGLHGMGTTVTAVYADGDSTWLAHVGDSRAYLLRDGALHQLTHDHTLVQQLVDEGRIGADDASSHPRRSVLTRALDGREPIEMDLVEVTFQPGDRLLLCTDGLSAVVSDDSIRDVLASEPDPDAAAQRLVELALRGGGPDNITCVVADAREGPHDDGTPVVAGAALTEQEVPATPEDTPATRAAQLDDGPSRRHARARRIRRRRLVLVLLATIALLGVGAAAGWTWVQAQYYVGVEAGQVVIYRGVEGSLGGVELSRVAERPGLALTALPPYEQDRVRDGIHATSRSHAREILDRLRQQAVSP